MTKQDKLKQAFKLQEAKKTGDTAFVLLEKLDSIEEKVDNIKPTDLSRVEQSIKELKDEEVEVNLEII